MKSYRMTLVVEVDGIDMVDVGMRVGKALVDVVEDMEITNWETMTDE